MATKEEKKKKKFSPLTKAAKKAGRFFATRTGVGGDTRLERIGKSLTKSPTGALGRGIGSNVARGVPTTKNLFRREGVAGVLRGAVEGAGDVARDVKGVGENILFGSEGRPDAPITPEVAPVAPVAEQAQAPVAGAPTQRRFFRQPNISSQEAREKMFKGSREATSLFGLKQLGETSAEKETRLANRIPRERTTATKRALEGELAEVKATRRKGVDIAAGEARQELVNEGELAQALAGNIQSLNEIRGKVQAATISSRNKAFGDAVSSVMGNQLLSDEQRASQIDKVQEIFSAGVETGAEVAGATPDQAGRVAGDLDGDGQISDQEKQYNKIAIALKNKQKPDGTPYTPAELKFMQKTQSGLAKTLGLV